MNSFPWWLIFPVMGMSFGLMSMWLRHRRSESTFELIKMYVAQGKEPPPELLRNLQQGGDPKHDQRSAIFTGSLAAGFVVAWAVLQGVAPRDAKAFLIAGIIFGFVALGKALTKRQTSAPSA